jgi:SAM-dependent methyltransferase
MFTDFAASLYLWSNRFFRALHGGSQVLFEGFWMGLLPESVYDAISEKSYGEGKNYTHASYLDKGLHFWENLAVQTYFPPGSRVLVAAAGGGRELIALERSGFQAAGFECSHAMVEAGKRALAERGVAATLDWAPPSVAPPMEGQFDALIVGWNGYCYISPRARRLAFLRDLRSQLRPGSPVLVSTAIRLPHSRVPTWTPRVANAIRICTFRAPVFEAGDSFSGRPKLHFTRWQLERELTEAGFSPVTFYVWGGYGAVVAKVVAKS